MTSPGEGSTEDGEFAGEPDPERVLAGIADGVYFFDADWILRFVNDAAVESSVLSRDELLGRSMRDLQTATMPEPPPAAELRTTQQQLASGEKEHVRTTGAFETADGVGPFSIRSRRATTTAGDFAGVVVTFRDISERVEAETELRRQNERLDQFASLVSHDLRNPLNVAQMSLEMVEPDDADPETLARTERALDRMEAIIDDMLDIARTDQPLDEATTVSLERVATGAWDRMERTDATLTIEADRTVEADRGRLDRALENLFRNAVEHGGNNVTVRVGPCEGGFFVADDGPGIPDADRESVFESGFSTTSDGTGFGLDIVRQAVRSHDWELSLTESADGGARFEITGMEADQG